MPVALEAPTAQAALESNSMNRTRPHALTTSARSLARRGVAAALALALALATPAWPQVRLPSLGESAADDVTVTAEKRVGDQIKREVRRDPDYLDDPVL